MQTWVDIANIVTAVMAVAGVLVAAWLGYKAVELAEKSNRIAEKANETAADVLVEEGRAIREALRANSNMERQFLFDQVSCLTKGAMALVREVEAASAARGVAFPSRMEAVSEAERNLDLEINLVREFLQEESARDALWKMKELARALAWVPRASWAWRENRSCLADYIFDDDDEVMADILRDLRSALYDDSCLLEGVLYPGISASADVDLDGGRGGAHLLQGHLSDPGWVPRTAEAYRILYVWALEAWGELRIGWNDEGEPVMLFRVREELAYESDEKSSVSASRSFLEDWLLKWISSSAGMVPTANEPCDMLGLLNDLRAAVQREFLQAAVRVLRAP